MKLNPETLKQLVKTETKKIYAKMGLDLGKSYTAEQLKEAYGRYLLEAGEEVQSGAPFTWFLKLDDDGQFKYYGVRAEGPDRAEVRKGTVGGADSESRFKAFPGSAEKEVQKIVKWKANKENKGWKQVDTLPQDEETAYSMYGTQFGAPSNYEDVMMKRGEAELARREKAEAEKLARRANAAPRGLTDNEGNSDRKIYGKKNGMPLHTGLGGKLYYPTDDQGAPFQSKFKAGKMAKVRKTGDRSVKLSGIGDMTGHTQDWHTKEESKLKAAIEKMVIEHIMEKANQD